MKKKCNCVICSDCYEGYRLLQEKAKQQGREEREKEIERGLKALFNIYPNPHKNEILYLVNSKNNKLKTQKEE